MAHRDALREAQEALQAVAADIDPSAEHQQQQHQQQLRRPGGPAMMMAFGSLGPRVVAGNREMTMTSQIEDIVFDMERTLESVDKAAAPTTTATTATTAAVDTEEDALSALDKQLEELANAAVPATPPAAAAAAETKAEAKPAEPQSADTEAPTQQSAEETTAEKEAAPAATTTTEEPTPEPQIPAGGTPATEPATDGVKEEAPAAPEPAVSVASSQEPSPPSPPSPQEPSPPPSPPSPPSAQEPPQICATPPSTPTKPQDQETSLMASPVTTLTAYRIADIATPPRVHATLAHTKSRSLSVRVGRESLVPPVPIRAAPLAPHQRRAPSAFPPTPPSAPSSPAFNTARGRHMAAAAATAAGDPTMAEMQGVISQEVIDALVNMPSGHRRTVAVGEEEGGETADPVQLSVFNTPRRAKCPSEDGTQQRSPAPAATPRKQPPRHRELLPWLRDLCVDRETGRALHAARVELRHLTTLSDEDLIQMGVHSLSRRLQLFFNIWLCTPWLYKPGDPDEFFGRIGLSKSTSMPDIHEVAPLSPAPEAPLSPPAASPAAATEAAAATAKEGEPSDRAPESPLALAAAEAQSLVAGKKCDQWYHESGSERRKRTVHMAEFMRQTAQRIALLKQMLLDETGHRGGKPMKSADAKIMRFYFDLQAVWENLAKAVDKALLHWNKATGLGEALLEAAHVEHWCGTFMQYFLSRGLAMSMLEPLATAKALKARFASIQEQLGDSVLAVFYSQATSALLEFRTEVESVRATTHMDHPDFRRLCTVHSRIIALQSADERTKASDRTKMDDLRTLERMTLGVMGGPRHIASWGRSFVLEGDLVELRPDLAAKRKKFKLHWAFMLLSDILLLGKREGRRMRVKHAYALTAPMAAVLDIEDGHPINGAIAAENAWALQLETAIFFEASSQADKTQIMEVFRQTLRSHAEARRRTQEEQETVQAQLAL